MTPSARRVPTPRLALILLAVAPLSLAAGALLRGRAGQDAALAALACALLPALADGLRCPRVADVRCGRSLAGTLRAGRPAAVALAFRWSPPGRAAARALWWADGPAASTVPRAPEGRARLRPGEPLAVGYTVCPLRRGTVRWDGPRFTLDSPWGLWRLRVDAAQGLERTVYPAAAPASGGRGRLAAAGVPAAGDGGLEFDGVRPYLPGEDARRMDWRALARRDQPVVRRLRPERGLRLMLVVDAGRWSAQGLGGGPPAPTRLDAFCEAALRVAQAALRDGAAVGALLLTSAGPAPSLAPRAGPTALHRLADLLARQEPSAGDPDLAAAAARLLAVPADAVLWFGEAPDLAEAAGLLRHLPQLARRRAVAFVAVRAAWPPPAPVAAAAGERAALLRAVVRRAEADRGAVLRALAGRGVPGCDALPERLGAEALAAYRRWARRGRTG